MKNTKTMFLISFFGCFVLPILVGLFAALSIFFDMSGSISNWILLNGGVWILAVYQILIVLITVMLWLTLKLQDAEKITTADVVRGQKSSKTILKVPTINVSGIKKLKRKEVKVPEKRNVFNDTLSEEIPVVKQVGKHTTISEPKKAIPLRKK